MGPSVMENKRGGLARAMTRADIEDVVDLFASAAWRAKDAGFDGVQIHAAHGYMVSSFLSPHYNRRKDEYGGSVANRARLFIEILDKIRAKVGPDYPVITKLNSSDLVEGGLTPEMMVETGLILEKNGLDAIELAGGSNTDNAHPDVSSLPIDPKSPDEEGYFVEAAKLYKKQVKIPLILVGGFRSLEGCSKILDANIADFISLSRPLVREPRLINRWQAGDIARARCISCNLCRKVLFAEQVPGLMCPVEKK